MATYRVAFSISARAIHYYVEFVPSIRCIPFDVASIGFLLAVMICLFG
jgi:hypothetical protein